MYARSAALARGDYGRAARYRGDPGLFGFLGKAAGGLASVAAKILPGPAGAIAGTLGGVLIGRRTATPPIMPSGSFLGLRAGGPRGLTLGVETYRGASATVSQAAGAPGMTNGGCPSGYHPCKSKYGCKSGPCVRNRSMNPGNPRAVRRSLRRVAGFGKLAARARRDISRAATAVGVRRSTRKAAFGRKR